jgi:hypothetical protein
VARTEDKVVLDSPWKIVAAEKIKQRSRGAKASIWRVTFSNGKESIAIDYQAEHSLKTGARKKRYISGGTAVVKRLTRVTEGALFPDVLALKSILLGSEKEYQQQLEAKAAVSEVDLLISFGMQAYLVKRDSERTTKYAVLESYLPGGDLFDLLTSISTGEKLPLAPELVYLLLARLMARIQFFHEATGRAILDIKPENMLCVFEGGALQDVLLVDLGSSLGDAFNVTGRYIPREDRYRYHGLKSRKGPDAAKQDFINDLALDFRILSATAFYMLVPQEVCPDGWLKTLPGRLYTILGNARGDVKAPTLLTEIFGEDSAYHEAYFDCLSACRRRFTKQRPDKRHLERIEAVMAKGDLAGMAQLLNEEHLPLDAQTRSGDSLLVAAVKARQVDLLRYLIRQGANVLQPSGPEGEIPLMAAVRGQARHCVRALMANKAKQQLACKNASGQTAHALAGSSREIRALLQPQEVGLSVVDFTVTTAGAAKLSGDGKDADECKSDTVGAKAEVVATTARPSCG